MYGPTIREIRRNKKIRANEVFEGIVSKSFYYNFEQGRHEIGAEKFQQILTRLEISFSEFDYIHHDFQIDLQQTMYQQILTLYRQLDQRSMSALQKIYEENYQSADRRRQLYASLAYSLIYASFQYKDLTPTRPLQEYLGYVEKWTLFELEIFEGSMMIFFHEPQKLKAMMEKAFQTLDSFEGLLRDTFQQHISALYLNYLQFLLAEEEFTEARTLEKRLRQLFPWWQPNMEMALFFAFGNSLVRGFLMRDTTGLLEAEEVVSWLEKFVPAEGRILRGILQVQEERLRFRIQRKQWRKD